MNVNAEQGKIYGPLGHQVDIEHLPEEFYFFADEDIGSLVHIPCGTVIAHFGTNATPEIILKAANEHIWCPALGGGISSG